jgi:hypothetical protein
VLQRTVEEQELYLRWHRHRETRTTPRTLLRESDELMYWLEECMLQDVRLVPGWFMPRLTRVVAAADPELVAELSRERRPASVIELLYRAQEILMEGAVRSRQPARIIPLFG